MGWDRDTFTKRRLKKQQLIFEFLQCNTSSMLLKHDITSSYTAHTYLQFVKEYHRTGYYFAVSAVLQEAASRNPATSTSACPHGP